MRAERSQTNPRFAVEDLLFDEFFEAEDLGEVYKQYMEQRLREEETRAGLAKSKGALTRVDASHHKHVQEQGRTGREVQDQSPVRNGRADQGPVRLGQTPNELLRKQQCDHLRQFHDLRRDSSGGRKTENKLQHRRHQENGLVEPGAPQSVPELLRRHARHRPARVLGGVAGEAG